MIVFNIQEVSFGLKPYEAMHFEITKNRRSSLEAESRNIYFAHCFFYPFHYNQIIRSGGNDGAGEKFNASFCCRGGLEAQMSPQSPPQCSQVCPERGKAAVDWMLVRSHSPQLLCTRVILSSEHNLSNYISEKWYNMSHIYFTFLLLQALAIGRGLFITSDACSENLLSGSVFHI